MARARSTLMIWLMFEIEIQKFRVFFQHVCFAVLSGKRDGLLRRRNSVVKLPRLCVSRSQSSKNLRVFAAGKLVGFLHQGDCLTSVAKRRRRAGRQDPGQAYLRLYELWLKLNCLLIAVRGFGRPPVLL